MSDPWKTSNCHWHGNMLTGFWWWTMNASVVVSHASVLLISGWYLLGRDTLNCVSWWVVEWSLWSLCHWYQSMRLGSHATDRTVRFRANHSEANRVFVAWLKLFRKHGQTLYVRNLRANISRPAKAYDHHVMLVGVKCGFARKELRGPQPSRFFARHAPFRISSVIEVGSMLIKKTTTTISPTN